MMKRKLKSRFVCILLFSLVLILTSLTLTAFARDWWIMEVSYIVNGRMPESIIGTNSRVYLPEVKAVLPDGIEMSVNYKISKDDTVLADGAYEPGVCYDLCEEGTYVITYKGVDALNDYSFTFIADDAYPSIVLDEDIAMFAYTDEVFNVPAAKIYYKGSEAQAQISLVMANGNRYIPADKIVPESGKLSVIYRAHLDGQDCEFSYDVEVLDRGVGFYDENGDFYPAATKAYEHIELSGCVLNGTSTTTYTYSEIIDLSQATKDDPLIVINNAAFTGNQIRPKIKIVDVHDSQNYIQIEGRWTADNNTVVYSVARTAAQSPAAIRNNVYYTESTWGTLTTFPTSVTASRNAPATYYYDAEEKALYVNWYGQKNILIDLDAEYQAVPWEGFTTGEVYIVVERSGTTDFLCVENIAGHSLAAWQKDDASPVIKVNSAEQGIVPNAVAGVAYPVPSANAVDMQDSVVPVCVRVFKGYDAVSGIELPIMDGKFVPYEAGHYTIVYTAQDRYANATDVRLDVLALAETDVAPIQAQIQGIPQTAFVGEKLVLPIADNISGGCGTVTYEVVLTAPDGTESAVTENVLIFAHEGKNTLKYVLKDYLGRERVYSYDIDCTVSEDPILYPLVMPESLRSGKTFTLPRAEYAQDPSIEVVVRATLDGKPIEIVNNCVTPVAQRQQEELVLTYEAKSATGSAERSYSIMVFNADISDRRSFFSTVQGDISAVQNEESIQFTATESNSGVKFINSVLASKLNLLLSVAQERNDADRISILLTDSLDPGIAVQLDIVKKPDGDENSKSELYINGFKTNDMEGNFYGGTEAIQLTYNAQTHTLTDAVGNTAGTITRTNSGALFTGFPSGEVNVSFYVGTVGANGISFNVLQINNQSFYSDEMFFDTYAELQINGKLDLQVELGGEIVIPSASVCDVLSPNTEVTVSIKKDKEVVVDKHSAAEPLKYTFDSYGTYHVTYQYTDGTNSRSANYTVRTIEHTAPQVQAPKKLPESAKLNDRITLSLPTVSDDHAQETKITVIVREPSSKMICLGEDLTFTAEYTGTYCVMFYVYDECYNYQIITQEIEVTEQ